MRTGPPDTCGHRTSHRPPPPRCRPTQQEVEIGITSPEYSITVADVRLVETHLGFKARCSEIVSVYNERDEVNKACVEFVCQPNAEPTKPGFKAVGLVRPLHEPYR